MLESFDFEDIHCLVVNVASCKLHNQLMFKAAVLFWGLLAVWFQEGGI